MAQFLDIFRAAYNCCLPGGKKRTPAMRLGLAKGVVALEGIILTLISHRRRFT
jgi:riboflavin synthase alpha subunit